MTTFSAAPQALGYLYQARVALALLLTASDEARLKVEALDDIEISDALAAESLALVQLKHHTGDTSITDASTDLWKSLRVWSEQAESHQFTVADTRIVLLTTAKASAGSVASLLGEQKRDVDKAEMLLMDVANTSTNQALTSAFDAFKKLGSAQRKALLAQVYIIPRYADIDATRKTIKHLLRVAVHAQHLDSFTERIEGWWNNKVVLQLLDKSGPKGKEISGFELKEHVASVAESFRSDNLPVDYEHSDVNDADIEANKRLQYVRQLEAISASSATIRKAILDHHRAYHQRHRWLKDSLIFAEELENYELRLKDEWERYFEHYCGDVDAKDTAARIKAGKQVLRWAEMECSLKIRPKVDAAYIRRGCFHILADKSPPDVYWHPDFLAMMEASMASAATPV
ncbi:hypothetical protein L0Z31_11395 (plasmid) [Burkholderia vietnamiensis]|uniref:ABC-three component system protein n=1 Tax=Burkholderia vietnamiensis TaxID=60552 RepID=UPI002018F7DE|nr:ABC-three component system protein [Burkholderia vietnamiensis]MCO1348079.1 hypothetical protein [Burkholderia vietnamiensis]MCO1430552.1 hypothetical protein [Burkholderia vietnamiensis]UQN46410.1 hypothetical protein L0Y95_13530 [Burkholderia vietnamiensis]